MKAATYTTGRPCKRGHLSPRYVGDGNCVECKRVLAAARYAANPWQWHARSAAWRKENPASASRFTRNWQKANDMRERERRATYRRRDSVRERERLQARAWQKANPERCVANVQRYEARKKNAPGRSVSPAQWLEILHAALGLCAYCGERKPLTMEHIEPLVRGGEHDVQNLTAACIDCNRSKNDTPLLLWIARTHYAGA